MASAWSLGWAWQEVGELHMDMSATAHVALFTRREQDTQGQVST